jgi:hypothetical protein
MKHVKLGGVCAAIVVLAIAVAAPAQAKSGSSNASDLSIASAALAPDFLDPLTNAGVLAVERRGIPTPRAREAIAVQAAVGRAGLVSDLDAALGEGYGGAWYELEAAQLHVGVTSQAGAGIAEALAAQAGLGLHVTATPVRSSEAELTDTQKRLDRYLADVLAREEAITRVSRQDNAVYIELGSEVPAGERAALEEEASESPVEVVVTTASVADLGGTLEGLCKTHETDKAFCDPTIVGGTTLENKTKPECTTGPAVAQPKGSTEIYVLTAGHCVAAAGESFYSRNKAEGAKEEIGKTAAALSEEKENDADVAAIKVEGKFWREEGKEIPVAPTIAEWSKKAGTTPFKVPGETVAVEEETSCISGQTTGFHCGLVKKGGVGVTVCGVKQQVEVELIETKGGDSGAPWFDVNGLVQGTHVGKTTKGVSEYQILSWSFKRLKEESKLELELLTTANEKRM